MDTQMVGCENAKGTLNIHGESETCEVCATYCSCLPALVKQDVNGKCRTCDKPALPGTFSSRFERA